MVTKKRDRKAALKFMKRTMKRYGHPKAIVTDRLRSYRAAMKVIGNAERQKTGRWLNNRAENSHQPLRRRERAMAKFRSAKSLQKFTSIHSSVHNHSNQERHLYNRENFKLNRSMALAEWRQLTARGRRHHSLLALVHFNLTTRSVCSQASLNQGNRPQGTTRRARNLDRDHDQAKSRHVTLH